MLFLMDRYESESPRRIPPSFPHTLNMPFRGSRAYALANFPVDEDAPHTPIMPVLGELTRSFNPGHNAGANGFATVGTGRRRTNFVFSFSHMP